MTKNILLFIICIYLLQLQLRAQVVNIRDAGKQEQSAVVTTSGQKAELKLKAIPIQNVKLLNSLFRQRFELNRKYMMSLENDKLLQNFYYEAGITKTGHIILGKEKNLDEFYWGWDSPSNQLRGHFLGHWLSAAAYMIAENNDLEVKAKADLIVKELAECQENNGGEWAGSIPEKYLDLMAKGKAIWSPQYTIHKTLMGLYDMYRLAGSEQALQVLDKFADWFHRWTGKQIANNNAGAIYGGETSGMLEIWANLYGLSHKQKYLDLMERYGNPGLFQSLLKGEDALTGNHANASIPWSHGSARTYEVTGDKHWKDITEAFWKNAVADRDHFCTGGQNAGEFWIPPHKMENFLCANNQEHCTVYNMIRTADYLFRWSGEMKYADYIEQNLYNGILAQQNANTGMVAYFLPMAAGQTKGGDKGWGHPTMDFLCCHGSLVQAQTHYAEWIYFENNDGLVVSQYIPSELKWEKNGVKVNLQQDFMAHDYNSVYDGNRWDIKIKIKTDAPVQFALQVRLPWWLKKKAVVKINGQAETVNSLNGILTLSRSWNKDEITIEFPTEVYTEALPDSKNKFALMEGPIVLAGICDKEISLKGDSKKTESILLREFEQEYKLVRWKQSHYHTINQENSIKFIPLYEVVDERYTIYFPIVK